MNKLSCFFHFAFLISHFFLLILSSFYLIFIIAYTLSLKVLNFMNIKYWLTHSIGIKSFRCLSNPFACLAFSLLETQAEEDCRKLNYPQEIFEY